VWQRGRIKVPAFLLYRFSIGAARQQKGRRYPSPTSPHSASRVSGRRIIPTLTRLDLGLRIAEAIPAIIKNYQLIEI
jgi:hypothetical protein